MQFQILVTVLTSYGNEVQADCEELLIYNYGCLTKREGKEERLQCSVMIVLEASWADKISESVDPVNDWAWACVQAHGPDNSHCSAIRSTNRPRHRQSTRFYQTCPAIPERSKV